MARPEPKAGTRGKDVFLIGGGNSAGQAAMFFSNYARSVTLFVRGTSLEKSMSYYLIQQLGSKRTSRLRKRRPPSSRSAAVRTSSRSPRATQGTGETRERCADALFTFIGADAQTDWLPGDIDRDERGYIRTGHEVTGWSLSGPRIRSKRAFPGIFAAGDVRSNSVKRVASGVGEGSMVIAFIHQYLAAQAVPV